MIGDLNAWSEGYLEWNLVLDENGGPNHVGNLCDASIIAPGAVRIGLKNESEGVLSTAFLIQTVALLSC